MFGEILVVRYEGVCWYLEAEVMNAIKHSRVCSTASPPTQRITKLKIRRAKAEKPHPYDLLFVCSMVSKLQYLEYWTSEVLERGPFSKYDC